LTIISLWWGSSDGRKGVKKNERAGLMVALQAAFALVCAGYASKETKVKFRKRGTKFSLTSVNVTGGIP